MRRSRFLVPPCAAILAVVVGSATCAAITAKDVIEKMSEKERYGYLTGLIDMLSYQALLSGDQKRAVCVSDAFYRDETMQKRIVDAFYGFPDKAPEAIVVVTLKKACGG